MVFPWGDWQFWLVSAAALWGAWTVVRQLVPQRRKPACGSCASGTAACAQPATAEARREPPLVVLGGRPDRTSPR